MVEQSTRCRDKYMCPRTQHPNLAVNWLTPIYRHDIQASVFGISLKCSCNLYGEFARGCEYEHLRFTALSVDALDEWQRVCCRFPGARLCLRDNICSA